MVVPSLPSRPARTAENTAASIFDQLLEDEDDEVVIYRDNKQSKPAANSRYQYHSADDLTPAGSFRFDPLAFFAFRPWFVVAGSLTLLAAAILLTALFVLLIGS